MTLSWQQKLTLSWREALKRERHDVEHDSQHDTWQQIGKQPLLGEYAPALLAGAGTAAKH